MVKQGKGISGQTIIMETEASTGKFSSFWGLMCQLGILVHNLNDTKLSKFGRFD